MGRVHKIAQVFKVILFVIVVGCCGRSGGRVLANAEAGVLATSILLCCCRCRSVVFIVAIVVHGPFVFYEMRERQILKFKIVVLENTTKPYVRVE